MAAGNLADLVSQRIIDFIADDQKSEHRAFGPGAEVNRLHKSLVKMVGAEPPKTGVLLIQRTLEVMLGRLERQARGFGVQRDHFAVAVGQYKQIAAGQLPNVPGSILDRGRVGGGHNGAGDRQVGHQLCGARQHAFALALEILKDHHGIAQIFQNFLPHVILYAVLHHQQAGCGEAGRDQQHRQQEACAQARSGHQRTGRLFMEDLSVENLGHGFR